MSNSHLYYSVELFAGAGGLSLGLEKAGFNPLLVVEIDRWAANTLKTNRPSWNVLQKDITIISKEGFRSKLSVDEMIDLLSGGYPCQAFSYSGKRLGLEDARGTLFYEYAKALEELQPKMFLAENVKGLVSHDNGKTLETMISVFKNMGYHVQYKVLNSLHYGVSQKRERIFIIGTREDIKTKIGEEFTFPIPTHLDNPILLKDILKDVPDSLGASYSSYKKSVLEQVPPGGCWRDLPEDVAKEYMKSTYYMTGGRTGIARRLSFNEPGLTVLCSASQKQTERCHPSEVRPLTVRENARIQSFPDNWEITGPMSSQYTQVGNAVPVNLAQAVGNAIAKYLKKLS